MSGEVIYCCKGGKTMRVVYLIPDGKEGYDEAFVVCDYVTFPGKGEYIDCNRNDSHRVATIKTEYVMWIEP